MPAPTPAFESPEQLEEYVRSYFTWCDQNKLDPNHVELATYLDVPIRTLNHYNQREGYAEILEMAKQKIQGYRVRMLLDAKRPTAGVIFDLTNNYGWKNPQHMTHTGPNGGPIAVAHTPMPADVQNELDAHKEELTGGED